MKAFVSHDPERSRRIAGYAMVVGAGLLWGCWSLVFRPVERMARVSPAFETLVVFAVTVVVLGPMAWLDGRGRERGARDWGGMLALGLIDTGNVLCFFGAMQRTSLAVAVLTHYLAPVFVSIAEPLVMRRQARGPVWSSVVLALAGLTLLLEPWKGASRGAAVGALLGTASAAFFAGNVLLSKRLQGRFSQREIQAWHCVPGLVIVPWFVPAGGLNPGAMPVSLLVVGALLIAVLGGWLFLRGLNRVPASHASVLSLIEPVTAVAVGAVFWKEMPGPLGIAGAGVVLAAAWRVVRR
ncbi:MAG TPA: DMT family transporter [Polyangiaceae bacterium]|nr:DMT family transporter [Polyangiaceae bacterium]